MAFTGQQSQALGQLGSTYINDTAAHPGAFGTIQALTATTIATLVSGNGYDGTPLMKGTLTAISLPAGSALYGYFTSVTLTSGSVVAYNTTVI